MHVRRSPRAALAAAAVALALAAAGCRGPTAGELGKARFSYDEGAFGCLVGCPPADAPMAARSRVNINVTNADDLAEFTVSSTDESVATFSRVGTATVKGKLWIVVGASSFAAGDSKLVLSDAASGEEIDRLPLHVRDVQKIEVAERGEKYKDQLTIMTGGSTSMRLILRDRDNRELVGHGGIDYSYQGAAGAPEPLEVLFGEIISRIFIGTVPETMEISARDTPGSGTIVASSPAGATMEIPVQVIDASGVTSLKLTGQEGTAEVGDEYFLSVEAMAGAEKVHSPECFWTLSEVVGPVTFDHASRESAAVESTEPGSSATVTCTIGSLSSSVHVVFN